MGSTDAKEYLILSMVEALVPFVLLLLLSFTLSNTPLLLDDLENDDKGGFSTESKSCSSFVVMIICLATTLIFLLTAMIPPLALLPIFFKKATWPTWRLLP